MAAPTPIEVQMTDSEPILNDMKLVSQNTLEKHLFGRKFDKEKVKKWGEYIIDEIHEILEKKYSHYGFCIFFYMSDKTSFVSDSRCVYYTKTDVKFVVSYHTNDFYSEIRLYATVKKVPLKNFFNDNMNDSDINMKINKKISELLDDRTFDYDIFTKVLDNLCLDINNLLLERKNRPCSNHIGYINKLPLRGIYSYYKVYDLEFAPIFFTYTRDTFTCRIYLFFINN